MSVPNIGNVVDNKARLSLERAFRNSRKRALGVDREWKSTFEVVKGGPPARRSPACSPSCWKVFSRVLIFVCFVFRPRKSVSSASMPAVVDWRRISDHLRELARRLPTFSTTSSFPWVSRSPYGNTLAFRLWYRIRNCFGETPVMDMNRVTEKMQEALHLAQSEASRPGDPIGSKNSALLSFFRG